MKENITYNDGKKICEIEFSGSNDLFNYISSMQTNSAFKYRQDCLSSSEISKYRTNFTKTRSFDEAATLLNNGWDEMSEELTIALKASKNKINMDTKTKSFYDIAGYQASVPRYLQGMPTNMVNSKRVVQKQKIITINRNITYPCLVSSDTIKADSIRIMQLVTKLENQGQRVKLNLMVVLRDPSKVEIVCKVCVKEASERLNVSKMSFPMIHPSMFRRILFRFLEVYPHVTNYFTSGYGHIPGDDAAKRYCKGEYYIPAKLTNISLEDLATLRV